MSAKPIYAVAYARVSTPRQAVEGESLELQVPRLIAAATRSSWTLFPENHVFQEPFTGSTDERRVYEEILRLIKANPGKIKYFLVMYIDRFSREGSMRYQQMKDDLAKLGVELRDVRGVIQPAVNSLEEFGFNYDWSTRSPSKISEIVEAETASAEKSTILTRMIGAEIKLTQDGYHLGRPDDGFIVKRIFVDGKKKCAQFPDPDRAHFFREIFRLRTEGIHSDAEIVEQINALGFRSKSWNRWSVDRTKVIGRREGIPLTIKQLQKIVQRPVYCGIICEKWTYNRPVRARGGEPLVSVETFNAANRGRVFVQEAPDGQLTLLYDHYPIKSVKKRKAYNPDFPFKNVVMCSVCRRPLTASASRGKSGERFGSYHCARKHDRYSIAQKTVEPLFKLLLANLRATKKFLLAYRKLFAAQYQDATREAVSRTLHAGRKVSELEERKALLVDAFSQATTPGMRLELERKTELVEKQIHEARVTRNGLELSEDAIHEFFRYAEKIVEHPTILLTDIHNLREQLALFSLFFSELPTYAEIANGTPQLTATIWLSEEFKKQKDRLVTLPSLSWNTLVEEVHRWEKVYWVIDIVSERKKRREDGELDVAA